MHAYNLNMHHTFLQRSFVRRGRHRKSDKKWIFQERWSCIGGMFSLSDPLYVAHLSLTCKLHNRIVAPCLELPLYPLLGTFSVYPQTLNHQFSRSNYSIMKFTGQR